MPSTRCAEPEAERVPRTAAVVAPPVRWPMRPTDQCADQRLMSPAHRGPPAFSRPDLARPARPEGTAGLLAKTFNNAFGLLSLILTWARRQALVGANLLDDEKRAVVKRGERPFLEPDQINRLLTAAAAHPPADTLLTVLAMAGLRRGEALALRWSDVDWGSAQGGGGQLMIRRSIYRGHTTAPKTAAGERTVDIPVSVLQALRLHSAMYPALPGDLTSEQPPAARSTGTPSRRVSSHASSTKQGCRTSVCTFCGIPTPAC
jgi:integrase